MAFDWLRFFDQHRVEFVEGGANTSRDNVTVHCPFCGGADPSHHMSVNIKGKGWRCWRHPQHRGKNPTRLVQGLLGCDWDRAAQITGQAVYVPSDFRDRVRGALSPKAKDDKPKGLRWPKEFRDFAGKPSARAFENYLVKKRGFDWEDVDWMSYRYGLAYCTKGPYSSRIMFPVDHEGQLVSWTGRHIGASELRYKALSDDAERAEREGYPPALGPISHYLLWYDHLMKTKCDTLILCEGPFDALKVRVLGRRHGITATCFFTAAPTDQQVALLHECCPQFRRRVLLLDAGTLALAFRTNRRLAGLGIRTFELSKGIKDPGDFDIHTFEKFMIELDRRYA